MFMWTVGYTVGDMMYIAQTTADQRRANWFSKALSPSPLALWVLMLLCFLAYAGYQVYLSYCSYTNPDWSAGVTFYDQLDFPTVLICPMTKKAPFFLKTMNCREFNGTEITTNTCAAYSVKVWLWRFKDHQCALFNGNTSDIMTATVMEHTFMEINFTVSLQHIGRLTPFAVILYSPLARVSPEAPSDDSPSFLVVPNTAYWAVLTQEEDIYLSGPSAATFYPSTSSSVNGVPADGVVVTFSYSSYAVNTNSQVITYDWLSLVGVLGGAAAFACAVHEIVMIIFTKSLAFCCPSFAKRFGGDEEEEEEAAEAEEEEQKKPNKAKSEPSKHIKTNKSKGFGGEEEAEVEARSLQSVDLLHNGFNRDRFVRDEYVSSPIERQSLLHAYPDDGTADNYSAAIN